MQGFEMQFTNLFRYNGTDKGFSVRECKNGGGSRTCFEDHGKSNNVRFEQEELVL
jgi:hypothetical protein